MFAFKFPILPSSFDIYEANSLMLTLSRQEPQAMSEAGATGTRRVFFCFLGPVLGNCDEPKSV